MENNMFISLLGAGNVKGSKEESKSKETNSKAFNSCLETATADEAAENELISKKETAKEAAERYKEEKAQAKAQARADQFKMAQNPRAMGSKAFLYDMMYRNPDTLNIAEKQALKLDTAAKADGTLQTQAQNASAPKAENQQPKDVSKQTNLQDFSAIADKAKAKGKEETGKTMNTEASQAASSGSKAEAAGDKVEALALNTAKTEESNKTQQLTQTQRRQQVIDQIVTHMEIQNFANRDELQLRLNPEYLGELKIKLTQDKDGELSAQFITNSEETREVLTESRSDLRDKIEGKGLRLKHIGIEFDENLV
ncbi:flagellar hook-length control protein FliK [bacterium]|nr:flagellar hook-length control protein FliK [bacterium]